MTNQIKINVKQVVPADKEHWEMPFKFSLMDESGNSLYEAQEFIQEQEVTITIDDVDEPAYFSFNRDHTAYTKVDYAQETIAQLFLQARTDSDIINRYIAIKKLMDKEKLAVLKKEQTAFSARFLELFKELLADTALIDSVGGSFLGISKSIENEEYKFKFQELHDMAKTLRHSVATEMKDELLSIYTTRKNKVFEGNYVDKSVAELKNRQVKNFCLGLLCELDTDETRSLAKAQFDESTQITDKWVGASLYLTSSASDRVEFLHSLQEWGKENLVRWETFVGVIGGLDANDSLTFVKDVIKSDSFVLTSPNDQHIYMYYAYNKRLSLLTQDGLDFVKESILLLAPLNEYQANHIVEVFGSMDKFDEDVQVNCVTLLLDVVDKLDAKKQPSVYNTIKRLVKGSKNAVASYEKVVGKKVSLE
jgi:aminopeptidase N